MAKTASLVFFYMGEKSYLKQLAQESVPLHKAMEGYDHTVLLHHTIEAGPFELSAQARKMASVEDIPTKENFVRELQRLGKEGYTVDLFIFSHGSPDVWLVSKGTYGQNAFIHANYILDNVDPLDLRIVWQCNCYGSTLNRVWSRLGAKASAGSRYVNFYPTRFNGFINRWQKGEPFGRAVADSDTAWLHFPVQFYIMTDAVSRLKEWGGAVYQVPFILNHTHASTDYFRTCWFSDSEWQIELSGRQNMSYSSEMMVDGDPAVCRS